MSNAQKCILRKQKSCVGNISVTNENNNRRFQLQKQFSIDQTCADLMNGNWKTKDACTDSLRVVTAINCKINNGNQCEGKTKTEEKSDELVNRNDKRININIFLGHSTVISELDIPSDAYDEEKTVNTIIKKISTKKTETHQRPRNEYPRTSRPRLVRAMSAPCYPNSFDSQTLSNTKRRIRRKKIAPIECVQLELDESIRQSFRKTRNESIEQKIEVNPNERRPLSTRNKIKIRKSIGQVRSRQFNHANDIVTLVSLLSPGSSDSEKEENSTIKCETVLTERTPSLRKTGKSVSFQDDTDTFPGGEAMSQEIHLSPMVRRASFIPLASNIQWNRPPTTPAGSISTKTISGTATSNENSNVSKNGIQMATNSQVMRNENKPADKTGLFDDVHTFPEYVKSVKEKECWLLFQKMIAKGIPVTYETILRGMLTPTEIRAVEKKQKEIVERQASLELEAMVSEVKKPLKKEKSINT